MKWAYMNRETGVWGIGRTSLEARQEAEKYLPKGYAEDDFVSVEMTDRLYDAMQTGMVPESSIDYKEPLDFLPEEEF